MTIKINTIIQDIILPEKYYGFILKVDSETPDSGLMLLYKPNNKISIERFDSYLLDADYRKYGVEVFDFVKLVEQPWGGDYILELRFRITEDNKLDYCPASWSSW